ncbi:cell division ATP-binding protein FtsE [Thalassoporum mexicanum PCC 7367]|uniref:cell division ATP-binding protein FtsE n=1 Tax=Thalassoporum mexicanum TaxID=3457544 RepID=UPI00029FC8E3|nr:cell division ATP-binding protein FtsE [Pseudanabaena sp. PCC 7367]AFY70125.1 cell division ATP-binding protein FtsE [Pseudanabaena sp. PCC 7367]
MLKLPIGIRKKVPPTANQEIPTTPSGKAIIVKLENVKKVYKNGVSGLNGINLEIVKGDFMFITGHSGSGKSTLLKLLYGAEKANYGEVVVNGVNVTDLRGNDLAMLRRRIGIVFQDYKLVAKRTVSENVAFVLMAQGFPPHEIRKRLHPALRMVGLTDKADCFPDELSGGEQQRVSIARAIVNTPPLLLADEPTGNLDAENAWQVIKILKKLNSFGVTILVTTHDEQLVRAANHSVAQLKDGYIFNLKSPA